jgi:NitT/TauT family transport system substrate-binding protein
VSLAPVLSNAPIFIADEEGYFRKQGVEFEAIELGSARDALPALIEGTVDVIGGYVNASYFNAIARGAQLRIVADKGHLDPDGCTYFALVARKELVRGGRLQSHGRSKKWRMSLQRGSVTEFILAEALRTEGIDPDRVELAFLPRVAEAQALQRGTIDVALVSGSALDTNLRAGSGVVWRSAQAVVRDLPVLILMYGPNLLTKDPETGRRFMVAYLQGVRQYNAGRTDRNLEVLQRRLGLDREMLLGTCWPQIRDDGQVHVQALLDLQAWSQGKGLIDRPLAAEEFWEPRFVRLAAEELGPPAREAAVR